MILVTCRVCLEGKPETEYFKTSKINLTKQKPFVDKICKSCKHEQQQARRKAFKQWAVDYKGGKCVACGYNRYNGSLDFHHLDPSQKEFSFGAILMTKAKAKIELDKCVLLCRNCHGEVHGGMLDLEPYIKEATTMIDEFDVVRTLVDKAKVPAGKIGTVVHIYSDGKACEVEFIRDFQSILTDDGSEVVTYELSEVTKELVP